MFSQQLATDKGNWLVDSGSATGAIDPDVEYAHMGGV
jgi:hypothetical protein